jgi:hypothetical protein
MFYKGMCDTFCGCRIMGIRVLLHIQHGYAWRFYVYQGMHGKFPLKSNLLI